MSANGVGKMAFIESNFNAEKYEQILTNNLLGSVEQLFLEGSFIFQLDGDLCYTAKTT